MKKMLKEGGLMRIIKYPNPVISAPTHEVRADEMKSVITKFYKRCLNSIGDGIGLAGNQVGMGKRICAVRQSKTKLFIMVNPKITWMSDETYEVEEGCLSLESTYKVNRAEKIIVEYLSPAGEWIKSQFDGEIAQIIQHEVDHLNGILINDI